MKYRAPRVYGTGGQGTAGGCADGEAATSVSCGTGPDAVGSCTEGFAAGSTCRDGLAAQVGCTQGDAHYEENWYGEDLAETDSRAAWPGKVRHRNRRASEKDGRIARKGEGEE